MCWWQAGLDSLAAVELRNSLAARFGLDLPATLLFDHPSMTAIAGFLATQMAPAASALPLADDPAESALSLMPVKPLAINCVTDIIGVSSRYPSGTGPPKYWQALVGSADLQRVVPMERWELEPFYTPDVVPYKMYVRWALCTSHSHASRDAMVILCI